MNTRKRLLIWLAVLGLVDMVIPIPILGLILVYVVLERPSWFGELVKKLYS